MSIIFPPAVDLASHPCFMDLFISSTFHLFAFFKSWSGFMPLVSSSGKYLVLPQDSFIQQIFTKHPPTARTLGVRTRTNARHEICPQGAQPTGL